MSNFEADQTESTELWHVQLRTGEVRLWSLDQLDAAFQAEIIDPATNVLQDGTMDWVTLGQLLGLDAEAPESAVQEPQSAAPAAPAFAPAVAFAPMAVSPTPAPVALDAFEERPGNSVRPVVADLGDDLDLDAMAARPRRRGLVVGLVAAALALGGGAFAVTHFSAAASSGAPSVTTVAAGLPPIVPDTTPPPQPVAPPPIAAIAPTAAEAATGSPSASSDARLNDVQKKKLLQSDKSHEAMRKSRAAAAPARGHSSSAKEKPVFHKGGDKYDPLNSSL